MAPSRVYHVKADAMENLLQVLKPLGETIQMSAHNHQPVQFSNVNLSQLGNALEKVESEVRQQRIDV